MKRHFKNIIYLAFLFVLVIGLESSSSVKNTKIENNKINRTINLTTMAMRIEEEEENRLYSAKDSYTGDLTGYAFNCPLCNGTLGCMRSYNIKDGTITYPDPTYGTVRIVASSFNLPCGTIIRFNSYRVSAEPVLAIVLDRGVLGNDIDLLTPSEEYASKYIGRSSIYYEVLRKGWE
jgi:hypothetical protein